MSNYSVIVPIAIKPKPSEQELSAAYILADYFQHDVQFVLRANCKTPDFLIDGVMWELKSPTGSGKRNIQHVISKALKQSCYIVVDARMSKINMQKVQSRLSAEMKLNRQIRRLLLIDKQKNVVEIYR